MNKSLQVKLLMEIGLNHLNFSKKYNKFADFIMGRDVYAVTMINPLTHEREQCTWAVMETVYNDYRKNPEEKINEKLFNVLEDEFKNGNGSISILNTVDCVLYQLRSEAQKTAPFSMDNEKLVECAKDNIIRNKKRYNKSKEMKRMLKDRNADLFENYGYKIM